MATTSVVGKKRKAQPLDTSHSSRGIWLVKVPNYLSEAWNRADKGKPVGTMRIRTETGRPKVEFCLSPELLKVKAGEKELDLPQEHEVSIQETTSQCLCTFSEDTSSGIMAAEGKVIQRADIRPVESSVYMNLKKHHMREAEKTRFIAQHLSHTPTNKYKPVSSHKELVDRTKKIELKKTRKEKEVVLDLLFSAFQHEEFYSLKSLVEITQQPEGYLREILREVCVHHTKQPHKFMWELKPEYKVTTNVGKSLDQ